jgi:polyhydroxyalkanoate synthesis regulator protein
MAQNNGDEPRTLEIRKYQNRRYYDSTRSRHLSLQQIHKVIIEGYNIRVLDAKTNEDITPKVLRFSPRFSSNMNRSSWTCSRMNCSPVQFA